MAPRRLFARRPPSKANKDKGIERIESWRVDTHNEEDKKKGSAVQSSSRGSQQLVQDVKRTEPAPVSRTAPLVERTCQEVIEGGQRAEHAPVSRAVPFVEQSCQEVIEEVQRTEPPPVSHPVSLEESSCQEAVEDVQCVEPAHVSQTVSSRQQKGPPRDCRGVSEADGRKEKNSDPQRQPGTSPAEQPKYVMVQNSGTIDSGLDDDIDDDDDASMADEASEKVRNAYQRWCDTKTRLNGKLQQSGEQTADGNIFSNITTS